MSENKQPELSYIEYRRFGQVNIKFKKICAESSGTRKEQKTSKKGISIVLLFSNNTKEIIKKEIINEIYDSHYGFVPITNLHCTFLSLSSTDTFLESNIYYNVLIKEQIKNFLDREKCKDQNLKITLKLDEIRPGTWYGHDQYPIPLASNGTVVAIGKPCTDENGKFIKVAFKLVEHLKENLYPIFGSKFERKFPTIWSTLGYFNHSDFDITNEFVKTFNKVNKSMVIEVDKLSLVEFTYKDLRDAQILETYQL